jgi:hypothetical protein
LAGLFRFLGALAAAAELVLAMASFAMVLGCEEEATKKLKGRQKKSRVHAGHFAAIDGDGRQEDTKGTIVTVQMSHGAARIRAIDRVGFMSLVQTRQPDHRLPACAL